MIDLRRLPVLPAAARLSTPAALRCAIYRRGAWRTPQATPAAPAAPAAPGDGATGRSQASITGSGAGPGEWTGRYVSGLFVFSTVRSGPVWSGLVWSRRDLMREGSERIIRGSDV